MAQPVWVLSVDLQAKTATFATGMADAAKAARGSFNDIKDGANSAGKEVGTNMTEARHGVMLLSEEFGIHVPRALATFVASMGPVGAAMEAAFPFLAIIALAGLLVEHLKKLKEEGEKLAASEEKYITVTSNVFANLEQKLLEAGIRADELSGDHLGALRKQLELIDRASLRDLIQSFEEVAKAANEVFGPLQAHWYNFGSGSAGAKNSLESFRREYEGLIRVGKEAAATDLLAEKIQREERILELQKQAAANKNSTNLAGFDQSGDHNKYVEAFQELSKLKVGYTDKEIEAQRILVSALNDQMTVENKIASLKQAQKGNARTATGKTIEGEDDKASKMHDDIAKGEEADAQKAWEDNYRRALEALQQNEREKIEATERGSALRLAAIDAAIKEEDSKGLQETGFYRQLLTQRVETVRQMSEEERKLKADAGKEEADHTLKMGELSLNAEREQGTLRLSGRHVRLAEALSLDMKFENDEYALKMTAFAHQLAALDKNAKDYDNKVKAIQNRQEEMTKQHEAKIGQIKDRAAKEQEMTTRQSLARMENGFAQSFISIVQGHQTFAGMMQSIAGNIAQSVLEGAIAEKNGLESTKLDEAKAAARKMYLAGTHFPFPTNVVMAPLLGAMGFAAMMAFNEGGVVPGQGNTDIVPAMLTPGESVLPKGLTESLTNAARSGNLGGKGDTHVHIHHSPTINALDSAGMERALKKHAEVIARHVNAEIRRTNR